MEGVYEVTRGKIRFGETVVLKWAGQKLSIFAINSYMVFKSGMKDSSFFMEGYWRVPTSDANGLVSLAIEKTEGGRELMKGKAAVNLRIRGNFGDESGPPGIDLELKYLRPFSQTVRSKDFYIIAHRAGGRTSDRLPVSENSIEMIDYTENFGSTGIEIDIRLTKDKVPVSYHDPDINIRLTLKGPIEWPDRKFHVGSALGICALDSR